MLGLASAARPNGRWRILDYGCGTGFEALQLLNWLPAERIERLTCYDPSPEMLNRCARRVTPHCKRVEFTSDAAALHSRSYNLVISNSLLHHLPDPLALMNSLTLFCEPGTLWLAGHEPSRRFYANPVCMAAFRTFSRQQRRRELLAPQRYLQRLGMQLGVVADPPLQTARAAVGQGLFRHRPSRTAIARLVDFHVAHSAQEAAAGRGFDIYEWRRALHPHWENTWYYSYGFVGPYYEQQLSRYWQQRSRKLAERFPDDGANFAAVWRYRR